MSKDDQAGRAPANEERAVLSEGKSIGARPYLAASASDAAGIPNVPMAAAPARSAGDASPASATPADGSASGSEASARTD